MAKVLCVDDDEAVARLIGEIVEFLGHDALIETDSMNATINYINDPDVVAVVTDYLMPRLDGIDILTVWQDSRPEVRRIMVTAAPNERPVREAARTGTAQMVITKPPRISDLKVALAWLASA